MEVKDFQKEILKFVNRWDKIREAKPSKEEAFFHIVEEIGELARQYVNRESRKEQYNEKEVEDAIGDALMQLVKLADLQGWNIEDLVTEIIKKEELMLQKKERRS